MESTVPNAGNGAELPVEYVQPDGAEVLAQYVLSAAYMVVLFLLLWHSWKRYGLSYWLFVIFFFQPLGAILYGVIHFNDIVRGAANSGRAGHGLFGVGLRARIQKAEQQMRYAETEALRAELAVLYYEDKRFDDCVRMFAPILAKDAQNEEALYYSALSLLAKEDRAGALPLLERLMQKNKKFRFGQAWLAYAGCLAHAGQAEKALEEYRLVTRAFPRPLTEFAYAQALAGAGKQDKAREVLEEMLATCDSAPAEDRTWVRQGRGLLKTLA